MRSLVIALLFSAIAFAQVEEKGRIEGRVVSTAGEPIAKAAVRIYVSDGRETAGAIYVERTTADGAFAVAGLPPGTYVVDAGKDGYQTASRAPSLTIARGQTERIDIQLRPMLTVSGRVIDQSGNPVPNVTVSLRSPRLARLYANRQAATDDFGKFRLTDVAPSNYLVSIMPQRNLPSPQAIEIRGPSAQRQIQPTYYPGVANPADATVLRVNSSIAGLELRALQSSRHTVQVTVASSDANASYRVMLRSKRYDEDGDTSWGTSSGTAVIPSVPPGEYMVVAMAGSRIYGSVAVTVTDANVEVTIPRAEPGTLKGRIRVEGVTDFGSFVAGALSARRQPPSPLEVYLFSTPEYSSSNVGIQVANDGSFEVPNVLPIQYSLNNPVPQSSAYVKSVTLNGRLTPGDRIDLSRGGDGTLEILLSPRPATIELTPPEGWPPPTAADETQRLLTVWSTRPMPGRPSGWSSSAVAFTMGASTPMQALPPGDYFAVAWEEPPPQDILSDAAFLTRFAPLAARVTVVEGGRASVRARLIPREEMRRLITEAPVR